MPLPYGEANLEFDVAMNDPKRCVKVTDGAADIPHDYSGAVMIYIYVFNAKG